MSNPELKGLRLTRSERLIVVALTYLWSAPVIYNNSKKLLVYIHAIWAEARREVRQRREEETRSTAQTSSAPTG